MLNSKLYVYHRISLAHTDYQGILARHASILVSVISPCKLTSFTDLFCEFDDDVIETILGVLRLFHDQNGRAHHKGLEKALERFKIVLQSI